jgi:hypothetical protein
VGTDVTKLNSEAYAAVYVSLPWHEKVYAIPEEIRLAAFGFYCATLAHCQCYRTDGRVTTPQLVAVFPCSETDRKQLVDALLAVHLFDPAPGGIQVHDYLDHNLSKAEIEDARGKMREGGRKGGISTQQKRASQGSKGGLEGCTEKSRAEMSSEEESGVETCSWCHASGGTTAYLPEGEQCPQCGARGTGERTLP